MKTKQVGDGLQHIYETEEEFLAAAKRLGFKPVENDKRLFFHASTATQSIHLYTKLK